MDFQNRGFLYGDGFFETIRVSNGLVPLWDFHWKRITQSLEYVGMAQRLSETSLLEQIQASCPSGSHRVRLNFWRDGGGKYRPTQNELAWNLMSEPYQPSISPIQRIAICDTVTLPTGKLSSLKSLSALPYVMAAKFIEAHGLDDAFLLNSFGRLAECGSSNVFLRLGNSDTLVTPALGEGCVSGVARQWIMSQVEVMEAQVSIEMLQDAVEIFTTNALQGPRPISAWNGRILEQTVSTELAQAFQALFRDARL